MAVVVFDVAAFKARYREFENVQDTLLTSCFAEAGLYLANTDASRVQNIVRRGLLLNMITAHIAYIGGALSADGQTRPVGRVAQAAEGSVSASFEYLTPGTQSWFAQSQYGAAYWQASMSYRSFAYRSRPTCY